MERTVPQPVTQIVQEHRDAHLSIQATVTASDPAERAPRLRATRAQASAKVAGLCTRLNRSSNRQSGSAAAQQ